MNTRERSSGAGKPPEQGEPAPSSETAKPERIAKRMARAGLCSRREAETWIAAGRVKLNGKVLSTPAVTVTVPGPSVSTQMVAEVASTYRRSGPRRSMGRT